MKLGDIYKDGNGLPWFSHDQNKEQTRMSTLVLLPFSVTSYVNSKIILKLMVSNLSETPIKV